MRKKRLAFEITAKLRRIASRAAQSKQSAASAMTLKVQPEAITALIVGEICAMSDDTRRELDLQ
jgi:hypothetical protein